MVAEVERSYKFNMAGFLTGWTQSDINLVKKLNEDARGAAWVLAPNVGSKERENLRQRVIVVTSSAASKLEYFRRVAPVNKKRLGFLVYTEW